MKDAKSSPALLSHSSIVVSFQKGCNDQDGTNYDDYEEDDDQVVSCDKLIKKKRVKRKQSCHIIQKQ